MWPRGSKAAGWTLWDGTNWTTGVYQSSNTTRNGATVVDTFSAQARFDC
jgi:hypothetical protein